MTRAIVGRIETVNVLSQTVTVQGTAKSFLHPSFLLLRTCCLAGGISII